jgi:regulator of replication initiation timing
MPEIFYRAPLPNKAKPTPSIITVKAHRPWLCPVLLVFCVLVIGVGGLFLHNQSVQAIGQNHHAVIEEHWLEQEKIRQQLEKALQNNASLATQNQELRTKLSMIVRTTQAGQETYSKVLQSLTQLQKENRDVKEELSFYQHLLKVFQSSNSSMPEGVIVNVMLGIDEKNRHYPYKMVLTQWTASLVEGRVQIDVLGKLNNRTKRLTMKKITPNSISALPYKLSYFQRFEGDLQLPQQFIPLSLIVRLFSKGQKKAKEIKFKWKDLLKQEQL